MQRGLKGTKEILSGLVEGMDLADGTVVYLIDALPNKLRASIFRPLKVFKGSNLIGSEVQRGGARCVGDASFLPPEFEGAGLEVCCLWARG